MTMIAPIDVKSINLSVHGCGESHEAGPLAEDEHWNLDCPMCELALQQSAANLGWATHLGSVKPTCDQIAEYERNDKEATRNGQKALAQITAHAVGLAAGSGSTPQVPQALLDQMAAMQEQIAELVAQNKALAEKATAPPTPEPSAVVTPPVASDTAPAKPARTSKAKATTTTA